MTTQIDLFAPALISELAENLPTSDEPAVGDVIRDDAPADEKLGQPIAVPCGFLDRANNPCRRLGNWPVMMNDRQMVCRGRPMLHCDPACFSAAVIPVDRSNADDGNIVWEDQADAYDDNPKIEHRSTHAS